MVDVESNQNASPEGEQVLSLQVRPQLIAQLLALCYQRVHDTQTRDHVPLTVYNPLSVQSSSSCQVLLLSSHHPLSGAIQFLQPSFSVNKITLLCLQLFLLVTRD